jgi:hypothetical protein
MHREDMDAQTDAELVDGEIPSLEAVTEKPTQRNVLVLTR